MSSADEDGTWHWHLIVPVLGLVVVGLVWYGWLTRGIFLTHSQVAKSVPAAASAASSPPIPNREQYFAEVGQSGDAFGGLNAGLTALAGVLVAWAGVMQHLMLKQARRQAVEERRAREQQASDSREGLRLAQEALKHEREEAARERDTRRLQEFEGLFFRLLELSSSVTDRIETDAVPTSMITVPGEGTRTFGAPARHGPAALASFASSLRNVALGQLPPLQHDRNAQLGKLVSLFLTRVYDRRPSAFGPYFRILYQTFRHISESHLTYEEQVKYANIARGQISEGAVLLLALNGLTVDGYKFIPLIEKFGLLEHLHRRYQVEFKELLSIGHRNRAFMGSVERALPGNEWVATPLLPADHFERVEVERKLAEEEADFPAGFAGLEEGDL
jgi:hypothetical protein